LAAKEKLLVEGTTDDVGQELLDVKPILKDVKPAVCGDGLPTHMFTRLARQEPNPYSTLDYYFGGFHLVLNGYRDSGRSWEESHLGHFFHAWRPTEKQLAWVMHPGDPNQIEDEMIMYSLAMKTAACIGAAEHLRAATQSESVELSPAAVNKHMLDRGNIYPLVAIVVGQLRNADVINLLHESEDKGDADLFRTATKFIGANKCTTYSTKYVALIAGFFLKHYCQSDAEKIIYDRFILFRKTVNGSTIFGDRFVEWVIRDLRTYIGKYSTGSQSSSYVRQVALHLNNRKKLAKAMKTSPHVASLPETEKEKYMIVISRVYSLLHLVLLGSCVRTIAVS
jgi:hypothetical protein